MRMAPHAFREKALSLRIVLEVMTFVRYDNTKSGIA